MKKVGKYLTISILLLLGLCCVGILYLFFIPNSSLFNITYISAKSNILSTEYGSNSVKTVVVNSRAYDLSVTTTDKDNIYLKMHAKPFGFVLKDNKTPSVTSKISNGILTFDVVEPHGFAAKNNSYVKLYVPEDWDFNLVLNNKSSAVEIDNANIIINDLSYTTETGALSIANATLNGGFSFELNNGRVYLDETAKTNANHTVLKMKKGQLHADHATLGNITIRENERGVILVKKCADIVQEISSAGGRIEAETIEQARITTSDTNLKFGTVEHGALITLTSSGSVSIDNIFGESSTIKTNSGSIKIDTVSSPILLESDTGNITVSNAFLNVSVKSNYGDTSINFSEDAQSYAINNKSRVLYATIKNGKLSATGVEHIGKTTDSLGIKITGNGQVNLKMKNVLGDNEIQGQNGDVNLIVEKSAVYDLTTRSISGNVRVNLTQTVEYNGYTTNDKRKTTVNYDPELTTTQNYLTATTESGDLLILDTNFA